MDCRCFGCLQDMEVSESRNKICAMFAGGLFATGWWCALGTTHTSCSCASTSISYKMLEDELHDVIIDASVTDADNTKDIFHLCGVFSFLSMLMVNTVSNGQLRGEAYTDGLLGGVAAKIWFFFGFMMGFGAFLGSLVIFFMEYLNTDQFTSAVPGMQFVLQNLFILSSSLLYRFGRTEDLWG